MKKQLLLLGFSLLVVPQLLAQDYLQVSQNLLKAILSGNEMEPHVALLASADEDSLLSQLNTNEKRLCFWINTYNGLVQFYLLENPELFAKRSSFFSEERCTVAGQKMSFDDIEHGILRRGRHKLSLGYFKNPFQPAWQEKYMPDSIDYRIHFALNCGAASCSPVAIYTADSINQQLDESTRLHLEKEVKYVPETNRVYASALMKWYRADFGGKEGIRKILLNRNIIPHREITIRYTDYDWSLKSGARAFR